MYFKIILQINCFAQIASEVFFVDPNYFPDYSFQSFQHTKDIRQNFIKNRKRNDETSKRIQLLDKYLPNNTMYVDDIAHYEIEKKHSQWKRIKEIETEFRNLIGMRGLKYIYKRDTFWRTWRKVRYPEEDRVICYRCENGVNLTNCDNGGFWVIEEKPPPCPFELFSISKQDKICAVHLNRYYDDNNSCSSEIKTSDLTGTCDNPIVTEWRVQMIFNSKVSERFPSFICGERESCTISTLYKISSDYIYFGIVNSINIVIYSRIMKQGKNYACIKDCGMMDPNSKIISKIDNPLSINLLGSKNKREDSRTKKQINFLNTIKKTKTFKLSLVQDAMDED